MAVLIDILRADWALSVSMDTIWETDVSVSREGVVEERTCTLSLPRRSLNFQVLACSSGEVFRLLRIILRNSGESLKIPLVQDQSELPQEYVPGTHGTALATPTNYFRFYGTKQILVSNANGTSYEEATLVSVSPGQLNLLAPLANTYPVGSRVFPLFEADLQFDQQPGGVLTDRVLQNQLTFREVTNDSALPPYTAANDLVGFQIFDGLPILELETDYSSSFRLELPRVGDQFLSGQGRVSTLRSPNPRFSWSAPQIFCSRENWHNAFRFFSSRRGRLLPFYTILPVSIWNIQQVGPGFVDVDPLIDINDVGLFTNLGLIGPDKSYFVTEITTVATNPSFWRLSIADNVPAGWTEDTIRVASAAIKCRFARDSFREIWDTSELPRATLEIVTLIDERDFASTIPGAGTGLPGGSNILFSRAEPVQIGAGSNVLADRNSLSSPPAGSNLLPSRAEISMPPGGGNVLPDTAP